MFKVNTVSAVLLGCMFSCNVTAIESTTSKSKTVDSHKSEFVAHLASNTNDKALLDSYMRLTPMERIKASNWKLTDKEYGRYKMLLDTTPRGIWTPNIDPITLLGIEARSETERKKYAKLFNDIELERQKKEIGFAFLQNADLRRRDPNSGAFTSYLQQRKNRKLNYFNMNLLSEEKAVSSQEYESTIHIAYIDLSKECGSDCQNQLSKAVDSGRLDIYFLNAYQDSDIFSFAKSHSIPSSKVRSGLINLNYGKPTEMPLFDGAIKLQRVVGNKDAEDFLF